MTLSRRVLLALVRETFGAPPAGMTAEDLAAELLPLPPLPRFSSSAHRREVLGVAAVPARTLASGRAVPAVEAVIGTRELARRAAVARVSAALRELTRRGYVERLRPPELGVWFVGSVQRRGSVRAALARLTWPDETPAATLDAWEAMVREYTESPGAWRPRSTGAAQETYRALVAHGVLVPPAHRWATEEGRARVSR